MLAEIQNYPSPFDIEMNTAILTLTACIVGPFEVSEYAPATFSALKAHLDAGNRMVVACEGSNQTIFGDPKVNFAFRAWHDWCHWQGGFDFSLDGESSACGMQLSHLHCCYQTHPKVQYWSKLLSAEVVGQRQYFERHGCFVRDQRAFATAYLADPENALRQQW